MKKLSIAFSLLVLILSSCSSSDSETTTLTSDVLVKKIIVTTAEGATTSTFTYDGKKIKEVSTNNVSSVVYSYTGDLITQIRYFVNGVVSYTNSYEYNASNQLIAATIEQSVPAQVNQKLYFYNEDGTISIYESMGETLDDLVPYSTEKIYFLANSINKVEITYDGSSSIDKTVNLKYDSKNNPYKNVIGFDKLLMVESSVNNNLEYKVIDAVLGTTNYISTYVYGANDFPLASLKTAGSTASNVTTEFFYE